MDYCQFAREVMFWNLYFCNSLNRKRPTVISTTIKEGNFISSTSVDFLFITVFLLMFKLFHVALKIVTALTHYFLLFFNLLTGRNYDFDFTHIMPHFVIFFAILLYSVYVALLWSLVPVPLSQSTSVPTGGSFIDTWHFITPLWSFTFPFFHRMLNFPLVVDLQI